MPASRHPLKIASVGAAVVLALAGAGSATAATVTVGPGQYLSLSDTNSGSNNSANAATGNVSALTAAGAYDYGNGFTGAQTTNYGGTAYGFYDDYVISIGAGQVDSITSSITLSSSSGISGLTMRLYDYAANGSVAPLLTTPVAGTVFDASSTTLAISPGTTATYSVLSPTTLDAGTYVVEVSGTATGANGGAYSGTLNLAPVPLPAALPLLLSGCALLGAMRRRKAA
jgi:hypothetical protein